jgi:hypothetical protein
LAKNRVRLSRSSGKTGIRTASVAVSRRGGRTVEGERPNVNVRSVPDRTDAPSPATPRVAPASRSGVTPYTLDSRIRTADPPRVTLTTCRTDWLVNPSSDQFGRPNSGGDAVVIDVAHAPVQRPSDRSVSAAAGATATTINATVVAATTGHNMPTGLGAHHRRSMMRRIRCHLIG